MALIEDTFSITVIVRHNYKTYERNRKYHKQTKAWHEDEHNNGCNHIDNIAGVADYMGQEIQEEIRKRRKI